MVSVPRWDWRRIRKTAAEVLINVLAVLGALCAASAIVGFSLGIRPFIVPTGSMVPVIPVNSLVLGKSEPATDVKAGQIVAVEAASGETVMHRVVSVTGKGNGQVSIIVKGDANKSDDPQPYVVSRVYLEILIIPWLGTPVSWLMTWLGALIVGIAGGSLITYALSRLAVRRLEAGQERS